MNHFIQFAASYLQKLRVTFESNNPETFEVVTKLYVDYSEKLENINRAVVDPSIFDESKGFLRSKRILRSSAIKKVSFRKVSENFSSIRTMSEVKH